MADKKISQLTAATTPLAGTEVLPIVQGGTTVKVSVDNLTAGKAVSASSLTVSGGTANGVAYLNAGKALTTGTALTFDGSNLGVGTSSPSSFGTVAVQSTNFVNAYFANTSTSGATASSQVRLATYDGAAVSVGSYLTETANSWSNTSFAGGVANTTVVQGAKAGGVAIVASGGSAPIKFYAGGEATTNELMRINSTGNLVVNTAGKGIDFSANTGAAGETSQLLNWYEEGTWTPTVTAASGAITTVTAAGNYTRVGRQVTVNMNIVITTNGTGADALLITGMPFNAATTRYDAGVGREYEMTGNAVAITFSAANTLQMLTYNNTYPGGSGYKIAASITYNV